ncbi:hypothetical protein M3P21_00830 [Ruegeria sp. 2012CJ41-6]|uniref:Transposase, Mutator family n=1 Tax=Ruegeria spongiae TaxID=2942209 RepID=A0ABT0PWU4_9RHOB|nr:hypothetical protein [Ruegeria spongiae]MCL6282060.1 hypothetical protein [Ruegeria spongiae]
MDLEFREDNELKPDEIKRLVSQMDSDMELLEALHASEAHGRTKGGRPVPIPGLSDKFKNFGTPDLTGGRLKAQAMGSIAGIVRKVFKGCTFGRPPSDLHPGTTAAGKAVLRCDHDPQHVFDKHGNKIAP